MSQLIGNTIVWLLASGKRQSEHQRSESLTFCKGNLPLQRVGNAESPAIQYTYRKSYNASGKYPTMHHFVTEMHISVTKCCIVDMGQVHYRICEFGL